MSILKGIFSFIIASIAWCIFVWFYLFIFIWSYLNGRKLEKDQSKFQTSIPAEGLGNE